MGMKPRGNKLTDEEKAARHREQSRRYKEMNRDLINAKQREKSYSKDSFTAEQWERKSEYNKSWRKKNRDRHRANANERFRNRYQKDPAFREICKERASAYAQTNEGKSVINARSRAKRASDPAFAIACNTRVKLNKFVSGKRKAGSFSKLFGCTKEMLLSHIESQFSEGMTWANRGSYWHLDHIMPLSAVDLIGDELSFMAANNYRNLRPLEGKENIAKSNNVTEEIEESFKKLKLTIKKELIHEDQVEV